MDASFQDDSGSDINNGTIDTDGVMRLRVRYAECDPMGVVHHSSYVPWFEMGRTELLRAAGLSYAKLEDRGVFMVITKLDVRYRRPLKYDDVVEVRTRVVGTSRVKIRHEYELHLVERLGVPLAELDSVADPSVPADGRCSVASTELACVNAHGRPVELPEWLAAKADGESHS
jgi:acyl-CoA thioester hydrolase